MKTSLLIGMAFCALLGRSEAGLYTNAPDADAFVWADAPAANYGGAGSLTVSGATATNVSGTANGLMDTFIRFSTTAMVASLNTKYGANQWAIDGATLVTTEMGAPANSLFNRGVGRFEMRWITAGTWTEGSGMPQTPASTGIAYQDEAGLLNASVDESLGIFTNKGTDGSRSFALSLPAGFRSDLAAGGEVGMFLTAVDPQVGFTVNSRTFNMATARPYLVVSAVAQPVIAGVMTSNLDLILTATNGEPNGTNYVLTSTNIALPVAQWTVSSTNASGTNGAVSVTLTNAAAPGSPARFFLLRAP